MSYSVSNLFKALTVNNKVPEGQLANPDVPEFSQAGGVNANFIRDKASSSMRLTSAPRNGDGYLLPRSTFSDKPKLDSFLMDGAIDPNVIRQRVNPISEAEPVTHEDALYGIDATMTKESNSVDLIQKARSGLYNYKNRFNAIPPANPIASATTFDKSFNTTPAATGPPPPYTPVGYNPTPTATDKSTKPNTIINLTKGGVLRSNNDGTI